MVIVMTKNTTLKNETDRTIETLIKVAGKYSEPEEVRLGCISALDEIFSPITVENLLDFATDSKNSIAIRRASLEAVRCIFCGCYEIFTGYSTWLVIPEKKLSSIISNEKTPQEIRQHATKTIERLLEVVDDVEVSRFCHVQVSKKNIFRRFISFLTGS